MAPKSAWRLQHDLRIPRRARTPWGHDLSARSEASQIVLNQLSTSTWRGASAKAATRIVARALAAAFKQRNSSASSRTRVDATDGILAGYVAFDRGCMSFRHRAAEPVRPQITLCLAAPSSGRHGSRRSCSRQLLPEHYLNFVKQQPLGPLLQHITVGSRIAFHDLPQRSRDHQSNTAASCSTSTPSLAARRS
jgi:hypothetical protein